MMNICTKVGFIIFLSVSSKFATANGFDLAGTVFAEVAQKKHLDPYLLYAVSLSESAYGKSGVIAPHRYTIRTAAQAFYLDSESEAVRKLDSIMSSTDHVDICLMQINMHWHAERLRRDGIKPSDLFDTKICVAEGAKILSEAIESAPGDIELGIGRYHNWNDESRARNYGARVLAIKSNLEQL